MTVVGGHVDFRVVGDHVYATWCRGGWRPITWDARRRPSCSHCLEQLDHRIGEVTPARRALYPAS